MTVALATFQRTWTVTKRAYPWTYFTSTVLAGGLTIALAYLVYQAVGAGSVAADFAARTGSADYVGYVATGAIAYTFTVRMLLWTAKALITEEREGTIAALAVAPARRLPYLIGFAGFAVVSTVIEIATLCAFAALLGVSLPVPDPVGLVVVLAVFSTAVFSLSVVLGTVMLFAGEAHITQNTCFLVMGLLCGFTFPRSYLPEPAQWLAEVFPITPALDVVRVLLRGEFDLGATAPRLGVALAVSGLYLIVGFGLLPFAERRVMERSL
jgi:ABC-2 type transport system permease protein